MALQSTIRASKRPRAPIPLEHIHQYYLRCLPVSNKSEETLAGYQLLTKYRINEEERREAGGG